MRIIFLNSSARFNGNTERLLKILESQLLIVAEERSINMETIHVNLSKENIKMCQGCRYCFDRGDCPLKDDVVKIAKSITDCDALIIASPVYMEDVNAIMKNWIDRMAFYSHRPAFYGKCAVVLSTSGSGASNHSLNTMKNALTVWGYQVLLVNKFRMGAIMENECIEQQYSTKLIKIATNLIESIQNGKAQKPSLFSLISFNIQQKYYTYSDRAGAFDRTYWESKGWLNPKVHFYQTIRYNPVKLLCAKIIGAFFSKLFI